MNRPDISEPAPAPALGGASAPGTAEEMSRDERTGRMLTVLAELVETESSSNDPAALRRCANLLEHRVAQRFGVRARQVGSPGQPHLLWTFGPKPTTLLLGHFDTVWPTGTITRWPFTVADGLATGPGVFDMKAGIVQALEALSGLPDISHVALLLTSDEELGSPTSRNLIVQTAVGMDSVLVLEPPSGPLGSLKIGRAGVSQYRLHVQGRAAHAGLNPHLGVNATIALAGLVPRVAALSSPGAGTTCTPTTCAAGTTANTVPATAILDVDVRALTSSEQERVDTAIRRLETDVPGAQLTVTGGVNRLPLECVMSAQLFDTAAAMAHRLGHATLAGEVVGGASDGNLTAGAGIPTLDGLGAVGDHAHAEGEYVAVERLSERSDLLAALLNELAPKR